MRGVSFRKPKAAEPPQADPEPSVPSAPAGNEAETQEPSQIAGAAPETAGAEASQASQASASQDPVAEGAPGEPAEAPAESAQADGPSAAEEGNAENVVQEALAEHADANEADNRATVTEALAEHASPPEESPAESSAEAPKPQEAAEPVADPVPQQNPAEEPQSAEQDTAIEQALAEHVDAVAADHDEAISQALAEHASSASQENETLPGAGQQPTNDAAADGPPDAPPDVPHRDPSHADEPAAEDSAAKLLKDVRDDMGEPSQDHQDMHHDQSFDSFQSASPKTMNRSIRSSPGFTSHSSEDLKSKLQFSSMTTDGVKKGPTFMHTVSTYKTGQRWSFGQKGPSTFIASSGTPAPGSYNLHTGHGGGRYKALVRSGHLGRAEILTVPRPERRGSAGLANRAAKDAQRPRTSSRSPATDLDAAMMNMNMTNVNMNMATGFGGFAVHPGWVTFPKVFYAFPASAASTPTTASTPTPMSMSTFTASTPMSSNSTTSSPPATPTGIPGIRMEVLRKANDSAGCRELQQLLQAGTFEEQEEILRQLRGHVAEVAQSPHGNFVLQQAIRVLSSERLYFVLPPAVIEEMLRPEPVELGRGAARLRLPSTGDYIGKDDHTNELVSERLGQTREQIKASLKDVVRHTAELSCHAIGNYSVQHCVEYGGPSCCQEIANVVLNHLHQFAVDPSGCGVLNKVLIHANAYQSTLLAVGLASHPYTFGHMATMQKGFAACQSLFHVCQRHPILEKQVRSLLKENIGPISKTKHGQALLHTLAPDLGAHRFYKSWPSENQQYQQHAAAPPAAFPRWPQPALPAMKRSAEALVTELALAFSGGDGCPYLSAQMELQSNEHPLSQLAQLEKSLPKFSFGGATRFAIGEVPTKKQPGPGAYNPRDPLLTAGPKVSFAGANAGRGPPLPENAPGPGAYEQRSTLGKSKMFTARGRQASSYMRSRSQPGPGAYDPKLGAVLMGIPKCGFGTSIRNDITGAARSLMLPGPGAYDMQSAMSAPGPRPGQLCHAWPWNIQRAHDIFRVLRPSHLHASGSPVS
eukprot:s2566_g8.t4